MKLVNTRRNNDESMSTASFSSALLSPISAYGGLWAPESLPKIDFENLPKDYKNLSLEIIKSFEFDLDLSVFEKAISRYDSFDDGKAVGVKEINGVFINELWHGPTRAFKDMALQPFGVIMDFLASSKGEKYLIIVATSGDTGPATLQTFKGSKNIRVICMYPEGGTSEVQRLQMLSYDDEPNLKVLGIKGNFDDAQNALKGFLANDDFKGFLAQKDIKLSAANSVNFGRILFQIIYHIYALIHSGASKENPKNIIVPSGNFGDALGAYYAKKMGAPVAKIGIASNANNVLTKLINEGVYDAKDKELISTISPAMDILLSSNVERLLFDLFGAVRTKELMDELKENKYYKLSPDESAKIKEIFYADWCSDDECKAIIKQYASMGELIDPHTATAIKMAKNGDIIASTAQWVKFAPSMELAIKNNTNAREKDMLNALASEFRVSLPSSISALFSGDIKPAQICEKIVIESAIKDWLK